MIPCFFVYRLQAHFAKAIDHCAHGAEVAATNDEQTLGFTLDLYARFVEAEKVGLIGTCIIPCLHNMPQTPPFHIRALTYFPLPHLQSNLHTSFSFTVVILLIIKVRL